MSNSKFCVLCFVLVFIPFVSSQNSGGWIIDSDVVTVSSASCGDQNNACLHATMTGLIASLHDPVLGTVDEIRDSIGKRLRNHGPDYPYPNYVMVNAVVNFLISVL